jgi:uncharacterized protein with HEPN domain
VKNKPSALHLIHILECIERIYKYTERNMELFLNDDKTYDAVIRNLQTMAESTQKLPREIKNKHPNIKWNQISGFRNILVHDYLGDINKEQIWNVIEQYLPELLAAARKELPEDGVTVARRGL